MVPIRSLPLQMAERLLLAQPDSVANPTTARRISINVSNAQNMPICPKILYIEH